jgi:CubicO group peptidase (beta-lactamase class C family)
MRTLVLCLLLTRAVSAQPIDTFIEQKMEEAGIMGLGAAIIVDDNVVWMKGYGFADRRRAVPFRPDTVMNIGSISKTFTGAALMRAVQDGKLSLDDDINAHLPFRVINPHRPDETITLRHLATHTSGITDRWAVYRETYHYGDTPEPLGAFLKSYFVPGGKNYSKDNFLDKKPGSHREYSNIGAGLAGYIVERAVGETLGAYAKKRIFTPLRMNDTAWSLSAVDPARHATLYVAHNGLTTPIQLYEGTTYPDGGIRTSVADLTKFFIALLNDGEYEGTRILDKSSVAEMLRFQFTTAGKPDNVDLAEQNSGIFWRTKFNVTRIGHGGSDPGLQTEMLASLSKDIGVILFSNTSLADEAKRLYYAIFLELWKHGEALKQAK